MPGQEQLTLDMEDAIKGFQEAESDQEEPQPKRRTTVSLTFEGAWTVGEIADLLGKVSDRVTQFHVGPVDPYF